MDWSDIPRFLMDVAIVAVLVFASLYMASFDASFTGLLTFDSNETDGEPALDQNVTVSIAPEMDGEISYFDFDQIIRIGNSTFVELELTNTGSVPTNGTYDVEVYNINNTLIYTYPGPKRLLQPGSSMGRTIKHTPHEAGTYIIRLRGEIGGTNVQSAKFLSVRTPPQPDMDPDPIVITQRRIRYVLGPAPPEPPAPSWSWQVNVPRSIELEQGGSTTLPIQLTNTDRSPIQNVHLSLRSSQGVTVEYEPKILFSIPPNTTRNFLLTVSAEDGVTEDQTLSYRINSDNLQQRGETAIDIVPNATIKQLRDEVDKLRRLIQDAESELAALEADGADVEEARTLLKEAKKLVDDAETNIEDEELDTAQQNIDAARSRVSEVFQKIFKLQGQELVVRAPLVQPIYLLMLGSILLAVIMVGAYYYIKEHHEERPKLLREVEEEVEV